MQPRNYDGRYNKRDPFKVLVLWGRRFIRRVDLSPVFTNSGNSVHVKNCGLGAQKLDFKNHY
jgi:hypothetical protein